jgi:TolB-like protein/Tfp pilus assembly protein PilF
MTDQTPGYQRFFAELKRRRVFRVMAVYGIVAFAIIEAADAIFPRMALPDWTITLIVWLALLGFPVAMVLAWAFEMTPGGVRRTADAAPGELTEIIAAPASKRWPSGVLALVGMTALLVGAWYVGRQSAPAVDADGAAGPVSASIAVLPFVNMSADPDQEYFSDGISEELLNLLAKIPELRVTSRSSAFSFKGENLEIPEIAQRLNVAHILEGSVRRSGNEVRVTAQLIDARSDTHLWSESWDRTLNDIFAIQAEIAADVAAQLKITLLGAAPTVEETDAEAYALFLQARYLGRQFTADGFEQSVVLYQQALAIDPDYAAAWGGLAADYARQANSGLRPLDEGYQLAREAANRALAIDPEYAPAHAELGRSTMVYDGDLAAAARHYERALELEPTNTDILANAARLAQSLGRLDEAVALQEYAVARDPVSSIGHSGLGIAYLWAGRLDEAIASFRTALSLSPGRIFAQSGIGVALLLKGEPEAALAAIQQESSEDWRLIGLVMAHHALGQAAESDAALTELIEKYEQGWAYNIAYVLAYRGEADRAFEWLDKAVQYNDPGLHHIAQDIEFANIHDDPRWLPFLESVGHSPEQLAAIEFEVRLPK